MNIHPLAVENFTPRNCYFQPLESPHLKRINMKRCNLQSTTPNLLNTCLFLGGKWGNPIPCSMFPPVWGSLQLWWLRWWDTHWWTLPMVRCMGVVNSGKMVGCYTDGHPGMPVSILDTRTLHVVSKIFVTQTKIGADSSSGWGWFVDWFFWSSLLLSSPGSGHPAPPSVTTPARGVWDACVSPFIPLVVSFLESFKKLPGRAWHPLVARKYDTPYNAPK